MQPSQLPNQLLVKARQRLPSTRVPGDCATRAELAELLNNWVWKNTGQYCNVDRNYIGKMERGIVRWPNQAYRSGLRRILGVDTDNELGFQKQRRRTLQPRLESEGSAREKLDALDPVAVIDSAKAVTDGDLASSSCRTTLGQATMLTGKELNEKLDSFHRSSASDLKLPNVAYTPHELDGVERSNSSFQEQRLDSYLSRMAVIGQLNAYIYGLREARGRMLESRRAFRIAAEMSDIIASISWDDDEHAIAQRYYLLAAQFAYVAGEYCLAASVLASLARQCFDLERPDDGLEVVQRAQFVTRRTATPRLRALLATREGWAYARKGDVRAFRRTVRLAEDHYTEGEHDQDVHIPTARELDEAELYGVIGARFRDLAHDDPKLARTAQKYIGRAVEIRPRVMSGVVPSI